MKALVLVLTSIFFAPVSGITQPGSLPVAPKKIKILSWNIYMLPAFLGTGKKPRAEVIGQLLATSDYDVIVFQEAFHGSTRNTISRLLQPAFPFQAGPANRKTFSLKTNSGIWIFSKHPIVESHSIIFDTRRGIDAFVRKGALLAEILFEGQPVQIVGTHLQNAGEDWLRFSQCAELYSRLLGKYERLDVPQIVCGDFNIDRLRHSTQYDSMLAILDAFDGHTPRGLEASYNREINDLVREPGIQNDLIDYVLVRRSMVGPGERLIRIFKHPWRAGHNDLSDHYALEAVIPMIFPTEAVVASSSKRY